jgi:hypothetical protein
MSVLFAASTIPAVAQFTVTLPVPEARNALLFLLTFSILGMMTLMGVLHRAPRRLVRNVIRRLPIRLAAPGAAMSEVAQ